MNINISYYAQLRQITGAGGEKIEVDDNTSLLAVINILAEKYGSGFSDLILSENNTFKKSILLSINDEVTYADKPLNDNDEISFYPAMSGG